MFCIRCTIGLSVPHPVPLKPNRQDGEAGRSRAGWGRRHGRWTMTWNRTSAALYRRSLPPPAPSSQVMNLWCIVDTTSCAFQNKDHETTCDLKMSVTHYFKFNSVLFHIIELRIFIDLSKVIFSFSFFWISLFIFNPGPPWTWFIPSLSYPNLYPYCLPGLYITECLLYLLSGY